MKNETHHPSRPLAVKLALIILVLHLGSLEILDAVHGKWNSTLFCIKMAMMAVMLFIPVWFAFCGRNWARWLLVGFTVAELCLVFGFILPRLIGQHSLTTSWLVVTCLHNAIDVLAVAALFLPSSSQWFRSRAQIGA
jgi:hypothetical protein